MGDQYILCECLDQTFWQNVIKIIIADFDKILILNCGDLQPNFKLYKKQQLVMEKNPILKFNQNRSTCRCCKALLYRRIQFKVRIFTLVYLETIVY